MKLPAHQSFHFGSYNRIEHSEHLSSAQKFALTFFVDSRYTEGIYLRNRRGEEKYAYDMKVYEKKKMVFPLVDA